MSQGKEALCVSLLNEELRSSFVNYERDNVSLLPDPTHSGYNNIIDNVIDNVIDNYKKKYEYYNNLIK